MNAKPIRIVIIDDQPIIRRALRGLLENQADLQIVGEAQDGEEGLKVVHLENPDVITLDLEMPKLDGFAFLRLLMAKQPRPVVVVSSHATRESVFRALELGAVEFCAKPSLILSQADLEPIREDLLCKLRAATQLRLSSLADRMRLLGQGHTLRTRSTEEALNGIPLQAEASSLPRCVVCIGASTGGPPAIVALLQALPPSLPISILITQHLPGKFTPAFVERLRRTTDWPIREAALDMPIVPGEVVIASGNQSLCVHREGRSLKSGLPEPQDVSPSTYVPSIDAMFRSCASAMGPAVVAVILSGMSGDGVLGVHAVAKAGGRVIVESPQSAVLSAMPEAAISSGVVHDVVPLGKLASAIIRHIFTRPEPPA